MTEADNKLKPGDVYVDTLRGVLLGAVLRRQEYTERDSLPGSFFDEHLIMVMRQFEEAGVDPRVVIRESIDVLNGYLDETS